MENDNHLVLFVSMKLLQQFSMQKMTDNFCIKVDSKSTLFLKNMINSLNDERIYHFFVFNPLLYKRVIIPLFAKRKTVKIG